jgi:hypothetical protein
MLVGKPEGKTELGRRKRRWEDNIQIKRREIGCEDVGCIHLVFSRVQWRAVVNTVMTYAFNERRRIRLAR